MDSPQKATGIERTTATSDDQVPPTELPDLETPASPIDPPPADREKVETEAPPTNEMPEEEVPEPIEVAVVEGPPAITEEARLEFATEVARLAKAALKEYDTLDAPTVLTAATGENAEKRAAFALAAAFKAAQSGDIETLNAALALLDDPHFPKGESLRYKAKFVAGTLKPAAQGDDAPAYEITQEQRLAIAEDLLASATREGRGDDYVVAQSLLSSAGHYLQRMTRNGFREVQQRAALMAKLDDLRRSIEDQRKHIEYLAALYEEYVAGLDATGHPRDAAACWNAGIYLLRVKRDWKEAIVHLAACDKPDVSAAAAFDAKRTAEDLGELIASAEGLAGGGGNVSGKGPVATAGG